MRTRLNLLLAAGLSGLAACSQGIDVEIASTDSDGLVDAIRQANASPGPDTIRLARNGFYILDKQAQAGLLLPGIRGKLRIEGNHAEIRGYSAQPTALLQVEAGARLDITDLVLAEGTDGAVRNYGELRLDNVAIVDSSVDSAPAIVLNHGRLQAVDSAIAFNLLLGSRRDAGTLLNYGQVELTNSRIHGNRALGRYRTMAAAGGVLNFGSVQAEGLQLEDNEVPGDEPAQLSFGGILNLGNGRFTGTVPSAGVRDAGPGAGLAGRGI